MVRLPATRVDPELFKAIKHAEIDEEAAKERPGLPFSDFRLEHEKEVYSYWGIKSLARYNELQQKGRRLKGKKLRKEMETRGSALGDNLDPYLIKEANAMTKAWKKPYKKYLAICATLAPKQATGAASVASKTAADHSTQAPTGAGKLCSKGVALDEKTAPLTTHRLPSSSSPSFSSSTSSSSSAQVRCCPPRLNALSLASSGALTCLFAPHNTPTRQGDKKEPSFEDLLKMGHEELATYTLELQEKNRLLCQARKLVSAAHTRSIVGRCHATLLLSCGFKS